MSTREREELASAALARVDALHSGLTQIVLEGGDLAGIAAEVARVLDVGVAFTSTDGRVRAAALDDDLRGLLDEHHLVDQTGRLRVERIGREGLRIGQEGARQGQVLTLAVAAGGSDMARLVCLRPAAPMNADDVHCLERAAAVAALVIIRQEAVAAVENKYQGDFLRDLLLRRGTHADYVAEHADTFGWDLTRPVVVVVAEIDPAPSTGASEPPVTGLQRRQWQERFAAAWRQVSSSLASGVPSADFSSEVVTLLPVTDPATGGADDSNPGAGLVRRAVTEVAGDKGGGRRAFSVGVSRVATTVEELPAAYAQARRAVEVGRRVNGSGSTAFFEQLGLHRLIALVPDPAELRSFVKDALGPLDEPTAEAADLRETLQVLLDTSWNVAEAARLQFFHYNTMRYRVSKLERLLGPLSTDPHRRLDVAVALRVREIVE